MQRDGTGNLPGNLHLRYVVLSVSANQFIARDYAPMNSFQAKKLAFLYARAALGIGFLSGVADRFGIWRGRNVDTETLTASCVIPPR